GALGHVGSQLALGLLAGLAYHHGSHAAADGAHDHEQQSATDRHERNDLIAVNQLLKERFHDSRSFPMQRMPAHLAVTGCWDSPLRRFIVSVSAKLLPPDNLPRQMQSNSGRFGHTAARWLDHLAGLGASPGFFHFRELLSKPHQ